MDCERILSGFLGQPVNAVSSLAFLACAAWIVVLALRGDRAGRAPLLVLALAVSANAVGSFARHGPDPSWAAWAHDAAIMAILLFIGIRALGRRLAWGPSVEIGAYAIGLAAVGLCLATIHGASNPFAGTLAAGAVVGEITTVTDDRRRRPPVRDVPPQPVVWGWPRSPWAASPICWARRARPSADPTACSSGMRSGTCWWPWPSRPTRTRSSCRPGNA